MRVLIVHPGADFSVADVYRGWVKALVKLGCEVGEYNLSDRLVFYTQAEIDGVRAFNPEDAVKMAARGLHSSCYEFRPDLVVVISAFYVMPSTWQLWKAFGQKTAVVFTESPYEDDRQLRLIAEADPDVIVVNDPTNIDRYPARTRYMPHAYDPEIHYPGDGHRDTDFVFVGTDYPSRVRFFEQVDWTGIDLKLAGHWQSLTDRSPLLPYVIHKTGECFPNEEAAGLYRHARVAANLYRGKDASEANAADLQAGWAMGPREVELAACQTFFLREPRGESDELFPMMPTFTEPAEFEELLRWWLAHDTEREDAARRARKAVVDRTFDANARRLLTLIGD